MTAPQPSDDRPEVSAIVSVLNGERFIGDISEYLVNQTFEDLEVIFVISSKCVDASLDKARESASGMRRAKVFEYPDTGELGGSKNYGKDRASGRCLWFLDVDDRPSLHYLEEMVAVRRRRKAHVVGCNFIYSSERTPNMPNPNWGGAYIPGFYLGESVWDITHLPFYLGLPIRAVCE